jgi:mRNA interferase MazF
MGKVAQRDVVYVALDPTAGHEQAGKRPAVVVSGNAFHVSGMCLVCPLTHQVKNFYGDIILEPNPVNGLKKRSEVLVGQIRAVDQRRIVTTFGSITSEELRSILAGFDVLCERMF